MNREAIVSHDPARLNLLDGLFIERDRSWVHIRRSNTESVMRVTAEADTQTEAQALVDQYLGMMEHIPRLS